MTAANARPALAARILFSLVMVTGAAMLPATALESQHPSDELNLFEWVRPSPVVIAGRLLEKDGAEQFILAEDVLRGNIAPGDRVPVLVRRANRERPSGTQRLVLDPEESYLLLLVPESERDRPRGGPVRYELTRGVDSARRIPREGREAILDAVLRLIQVQDAGSEALVWQAMRSFLEETNPVLVETALREFLRFRRVEPDLLPRVEPLFDHPRPDLRILAFRTADMVLDRHGSRVQGPMDALGRSLVAHARGDRDPRARAAATRALGRIPGGWVDEILEGIAKDDPEQSVRYEAERCLYERRRAAGKRAAPGGAVTRQERPGEGAEP